MKKTYRAMQVTTPGTLELVEREVPTPGVGEVLIAVPLEEAFDAYRRMKSGNVKFRMVLTTGRIGHAH